MARPKRNDNTREKLLDQGIKLFMDQGYHGTGIKEVVDLVKVPKGSFYNYFDSKEQFGADVIRHYARWVVTNMAAWLNGSEDNALIALEQFFEQEMQRHQEVKAGCIIGNLGAELGASSERCQQAMIEGFAAMKNQFLQTLKRGQTQGSIRHDISAEDLADFLINAYEGALLRMQVEQSVEPIRKLWQLLNSYLVAP
ncbi:TetR family transcriptional regulator C-terminal domain-containing protein [Leptothoe sp. ISB3NOV94-8A]|uniref:TetR family transcriptional regulator n=1 Tax=Adonisia turfae CCMR0081 TaxID=2292702 RepID=A0A6M0RRY3_9CYAN|nr:TetR/AcrR family transcriptional regulator [Adonisia turfae]MDV3347232.1 TetR family transcriptional regulator C-terminal domain-containing protein [Leptothoe sp. LEGE 181152]NEZ59007.1 TetR family transcriptional regulator [Adonisia turfae CCMR0081]